MGVVGELHPFSPEVGAGECPASPRGWEPPLGTRSRGWRDVLRSSLPWEPGPRWAGSNWCCSTGRRVQSARLGPSPPRLLTEEEYRLQGEVETRKALEELRSYCRSPDFSAWTVVSRIQSPKR